MKNAMQFKARIKKAAQENKISAQLVLQNYMLERFLERLSVSAYRDKFIIKGGFLIGSLVGINSRTTMDIDATIRSFPAERDKISKAISEIAGISLNDDISFRFDKLEDIREQDQYSGFRATLHANFPPLSVPLKIDITAGDKITPKETIYSHRLMFEDRSISILAYNLSTLLAEKLETVISRGSQSTRPRDYYDIYILSRLQAHNIDYAELKKAIEATSEHRNSSGTMRDYKGIIGNAAKSSEMNKYWDNYRHTFSYAAEISFEAACDAVIAIMERIYK